MTENKVKPEESGAFQLKFAENNGFVVECYKRSNPKLAVLWFFYVITVGLLWVLLRWFPKLRARLEFNQSDCLSCDVYLITDQHFHSIFTFVNNEPLAASWVLPYIDNGSNDTVKSEKTLASFVYKKQRFVVKHDNELVKVHGIQYMCKNHSNSRTEVAEKQAVFGHNSTRVNVEPIYKIFIDEVLSPLYFFELFSTIVWYNFDYMVYPSVILAVTLLSIILIVYSIWRQQTKLSKMSSDNDTEHVQLANGTSVSRIDLVVGDIIELVDNMTIPADCVLLSGQARVDESTMTGESSAAAKVPVENDEPNRSNQLYCGTTTVSLHGQPHALVVATGFNTQKGQLIQSILYPAQPNASYEADAMKFIGLMAILGVLGFIFSVVVSVNFCLAPGDIVLKSLDLITIIVPPALPAGLTVGIVYAQSRLKKMKIFTTQPRRINMAGTVNLALFDKTGTLTKSLLEFERIIVNSVVENGGTKIEQLMASCHSLTRGKDAPLIGDRLEISMFNETQASLESNDIIKVVDGTSIKQLKQFPFIAELGRSSTIIDVNGKTKVVTKGAPEQIKILCRESTLPKDFDHLLESETRQGFRVLALAGKPVDSIRGDRATLECDLVFYGFALFKNNSRDDSKRIIGELESANIRSVMVTGDNVMTAHIIAREVGILRDDKKHIQPLIINGVLSGWTKVNTDEKCDLSKDCQIQLTRSDLAWFRDNRPDILERVMLKTAIFARMHPEDKEYITEFMEKQLDFTCVFCGDGANDCRALKVATAGIALSKLEASAAAPFTAHNDNSIACVVELIREGRAALTSSFDVFKYMIMYSFIQFVTALILYWRNTILADNQYLYIDLFIIMSIAVTVTRSHASEKLVKEAPPSRIINFQTLVGLVLQIAIMTAFQVGLYKWTITQRWFCSISDQLPDCFWRNDNDTIVSAKEQTERYFANNMSNDIVKLEFDCSDDEEEDELWYQEHYVTQTLFMATIFMYTLMSFVFYTGPPYRQRFWSNYFYVLVLLGLLGVAFGIVFDQSERFADFFEFWFGYHNETMDEDEDEYLWLDSVPFNNDEDFPFVRWTIIGFAFGQFALAMLVEELFVKNKAIWRWERKRELASKRFTKIENEIQRKEESYGTSL